MENIIAQQDELVVAEPINLKKSKTDTTCYHCGTVCVSNRYAVIEKNFCCEGCKLVYEILNQNGLCEYYNIESHPGLTQIKPVRSDKYTYLDNPEIAKKLYKFSDGEHIIVAFYVPSIHCSSCMWLMENLGRLNAGITESRLNFTAKEITIHYLQSKISLRQVVELMSFLGYEPYISLSDTEKKEAKKFNRDKVIKLGVAGFCFGNIMMMSFPEYFSIQKGIEQQYAHLFRYLNLVLSLPVFFYCSTEFFTNAWHGFKQKMLNIDAPIALAIIITFVRSVYEILGNISGGYLDSMCGIVFFMLVGRIVQERTYKSISFHRDYSSYFPIAVNVVSASGIVSKLLGDLVEGEIVQLHHEEIIPADGFVVSGKALIDYSFVTGESEPLPVKIKESVYAGGRQIGEQVTIQITKPVASSYLTSLWNHHAFSGNKEEKNDKISVVHIMSMYFTIVLFILAAITAVYWAIFDTAKIISCVTAMLIVACPCALLLTVTFANGNFMRIFSNNGLFLRDASVIEQLRYITQIVFDKTGTLTKGGDVQIEFSENELTEKEKDMVCTTALPSKHPASKALVRWLGNRKPVIIENWSEIAGKGVSAYCGKDRIQIGSADFIGYKADDTANLYVKINDKICPFRVKSEIRNSVPKIIKELQKQYRLVLLSGDNESQKAQLTELFGKKSLLLFNQKPIDKLSFIERFQKAGNKVLMIGDGLNDAGALQQSNVGITLADDVNNFTPSCDAILDAEKLHLLPTLLKLAKSSSVIIWFSFVVSIGYNLVGLSFAMQGKLNALTAAILMPCSTLSIVLITSGLSRLLAISKKLIP